MPDARIRSETRTLAKEAMHIGSRTMVEGNPEPRGPKGHGTSAETSLHWRYAAMLRLTEARASFTPTPIELARMAKAPERETMIVKVKIAGKSGSQNHDS
jgi:hypothetical protein